MAFDIDGILRITRLVYREKVRGLRGTEETVTRIGDVSYAVIGTDPDNDEVVILGDPRQLIDETRPVEGPDSVLWKEEVGPPKDYDPLTDKAVGPPNTTDAQYAGPLHFKHFNI